MAKKILYEQGSTYEASGHLDFSAPKIQVVNAPVSGMPLFIPAGLPPIRWTDIKIVSKVDPVVYYADFQAAKPDVAANLRDVGDGAESFISDFKIIPTAVSDGFAKVGDSLSGAANKTIFIVIGILAVLMIWKRK